MKNGKPDKKSKNKLVWSTVKKVSCKNKKCEKATNLEN